MTKPYLELAFPSIQSQHLSPKQSVLTHCMSKSESGKTNDTTANPTQDTVSSEKSPQSPSPSTQLDNIGLSGVAASSFLSPFDSANNKSNESVNENTGKPSIRKYQLPSFLCLLCFDLACDEVFIHTLRTAQCRAVLASVCINDVFFVIVTLMPSLSFLPQ